MRQDLDSGFRRFQAATGPAAVVRDVSISGFFCFATRNGIEKNGPSCDYDDTSI